MDIDILIVDDHKIIRDGLRSLIDKEPGMTVVAEAESGNDAIRLVQELSPSLVIMDITLPDITGIDATRILLDDDPRLKVIALSMYSDRRFVTRMLEAGASGYLLKDCAFEELVRAVRSVMSGSLYLCSKIAGITATGTRFSAEPSDLACLSPREREVFQHLAEGLTTKDTAECLGVSAKTIESHRRNIMEKLHIHTIPDLIKLAIREGVISV